MKTFKIINNDVVFDSDKKIEMIDGFDEEVQALERCFTTNVNEWFLNSQHGLQYDKIRGKGISDEAIQMAVIKAATQEERVKEVISIHIDRDEGKRTVHIKFTCLMASGNKETVEFKID